MGQFKAEQVGTSPNASFKFAGHIDEDATFSVLDLNGATSLTLDLEGILAINSCGIREWIKWIKTAPAGCKITYQKCPKVIVDQINMVSGFLPEGAEVESFMVPYYSDATDTEKMVLFNKGKEFKDGEVFPPEDIKDEGGELMEMDVIEAKYFKFIKK